MFFLSVVYQISAFISIALLLLLRGQDCCGRVNASRRSSPPPPPTTFGLKNISVRSYYHRRDNVSRYVLCCCCCCCCCLKSDYMDGSQFSLSICHDKWAIACPKLFVSVEAVLAIVESLALCNKCEKDRRPCPKPYLHVARSMGCGYQLR